MNRINITKAQMKLGENIAILIAFAFLVAIGLLFYYRYQRAELEAALPLIQQEEAVKAALRISYLPEITCTSGGVVEFNCFDVHKLLAFKELMDKRERGYLFYQQDFGKSNVVIQQIFPEPLDKIILYDNRPEHLGVSRQTQIPVRLFDATRRGRENSLGIMTVTVYEEAKT